MQRTKQMIAPHFDGWQIPQDRPVSGWRQRISDVLVQSQANLSSEARRGFLTALYAMQANELPGAFLRSVDTIQTQREIRRAIRILTEEE